MDENQIRLDLELSLAQVRATIYADCRVLDFGINEKGFAIALAVGESNGAHDWTYHDILVTAVGVGITAEWEAYATEYPVEEFWAEHVEEIVSEFFKQNPEYQKAIEGQVE